MNDPLGLFEEDSNNDPLGLFQEQPRKEAGLGVSFKQALAGAGNAIEQAISLPAGALARYAGFEEDSDRIFREMEANAAFRNKWANPENLQTSTVNDVLGTVLSLPAQIPAMFGQAATKGVDLIQRGEPLSAAIPATLTEAGMAAAGVAPMAAAPTFLGRAAIGGGANMAMGAGSDAVTQLLATQESTKEAYNPYDVKRRLTEGLVGGITQGALGERPTAKPTTKVNSIKEAQAARDIVPKEVADAPLSVMENMARQLGAEERVAQPEGVRTPIRDVADELLGLDERAARLRPEEPAPTNETRQLEMFDQPEQGRVPMQYEATTGDWRVDENGMPVRVDLSLEAQNLQNPLQRNLWGDELDVQVPRDPGAPLAMDRDVMGYPRLTEPSIMRGDIENQRPLTEAIDMLDPTVRNRTEQGRFAEGTIRDSALQTLRGELPASGELEAARVQAEGQAVTPPKAVTSLQKMGMRKKQGGVLKIDWSDMSDAENALIRSPDGSFIPENPEVASTLQNAKQFIKDKIAKGQSPDINVIQNLQSGSTSVAMKTGNPLIKAVSEIVQNAGKRADLAIRNTVFPAEQALRKLPKQELIDLSDLMKDEMFNNRRFDADILANNLTEKQLRAYVQMRDLFDKTLDAQNVARRALGKPEVTAKEAYLSSRWQGDFRQPVYDKEGRLVWYLASDSKLGLNAQTKALQKQFPDLVVDPKKARTVKSGKTGQDLQSMYSTVLDVLGRDDPAVQRIKEFVEAQTAIEGEAALGQTKHFKSKGNVRGFVGDRPGFTGIKEATAMMQQQIQYAKNAFQWSEMQKAAGDIKGLLADSEVQEAMPNAVKYSREYFKNALGFGESNLAKAFDDSVRGVGISPATIRSAVGNLKSFFILQKLALSTGYVAANMIQTANTIPYLMNLRSQGYKGNPLTALTVGLFGTLPMAWSHHMKSWGVEYKNALPTQFLKDAFQYAEDNGVTARSIYDEAPVAESFSPVGTAARVAGKTMTVPETIVRSFAFMTYAQMLKDSGKFTDQTKMFQKAEELVNMSMVDYRETERPLIFGKAGTTGNMLNTLQTYPISFYNQFAYMAGEAAKGRPAGLAAMLMFQAAAAGALGLPYVQDLEKLFAWMRDNLTDDETYTSMMESEFFSDPRLWLIEKGNDLGNLITQEMAEGGLNVDFTRWGESAVYGPLSTASGVSMTSRVAAPSPSEMLQSPVGPISDIAKQIGSAGKAIVNPSQMNLAQAAMNSAPVGLQGLLETAPFMEGITYDTRQDGTRVYRKASDLADQQAMYLRTPAEDDVRKFGVRSQAEAMTKDIAYRTKSSMQEIRQRAQSLPDKILNAAKAGDVAKTEELVSVYVRLTGRSISSTQLQNQIKEAYMTEVERLMTKKTLSPMEAMRVAKLKKIVETNQ